MGAFSKIEAITIPNPNDPDGAAAFRRKWKWEEHEQVLIKGSVTVSDQEYVTNHYGQSGKKGDIEYRMGNGRFAILDRMIQSWTFLDDDGHRVPVTVAAIRQLPANYANPILEVIDDMGRSMTEEEQETFLTSANGHIVEASSSENLSLTKL